MRHRAFVSGELCYFHAFAHFSESRIRAKITNTLSSDLPVSSSSAGVKESRLRAALLVLRVITVAVPKVTARREQLMRTYTGTALR
jgi:hypothetical protein